MNIDKAKAREIFEAEKSGNLTQWEAMTMIQLVMAGKPKKASHERVLTRIKETS